jgi:hypothetical protein
MNVITIISSLGSHRTTDSPRAGSANFSDLLGQFPKSGQPLRSDHSSYPAVLGVHGVSELPARRSASAVKVGGNT